MTRTSLKRIREIEQKTAQKRQDARENPSEHPEEIQKHLRELRKIISTGATRSLQLRCSTLKIWRRSSPHNWWVENKHGNILWHSDEDRRYRRLPLLDVFEKGQHSSNPVGCYLPGIVSAREASSPEETGYRLKDCYCV